MLLCILGGCFRCKPFAALTGFAEAVSAAVSVITVLTIGRSVSTLRVSVIPIATFVSAAFTSVAEAASVIAVLVVKSAASLTVVAVRTIVTVLTVIISSGKTVPVITALVVKSAASLTVIAVCLILSLSVLIGSLGTFLSVSLLRAALVISLLICTLCIAGCRSVCYRPLRSRTLCCLGLHGLFRLHGHFFRSCLSGRLARLWCRLLCRV